MLEVVGMVCAVWLWLELGVGGLSPCHRGLRLSLCSWWRVYLRLAKTTGSSLIVGLVGATWALIRPGANAWGFPGGSSRLGGGLGTTR